MTTQDEAKPLEDDEEDAIRELVLARKTSKIKIIDDEKEPELPKPEAKVEIPVKPKERRSRIGLGGLKVGSEQVGLKFAPQSREKLVLYPHDKQDQEDDDDDAEVEGGMSLVSY